MMLTFCMWVDIHRGAKLVESYLGGCGQTYQDMPKVHQNNELTISQERGDV